MKTFCPPLASRLCAGLLLLFLAGHAAAQPTAFPYQGFLSEADTPLHGFYDLRFELRDAATAGNLVAAPVTIARVPVANGVFSVTLDFGPGVFTGAPRWVEMGTRANGSFAAFTVLPRVQVISTPYAIRAFEAGTLGSPLSESLLPAVVARLNAPQTFTGASLFAPASGPPFTVGAGNTALVPNLNAEFLGGLGAGSFWRLGGNNVADPVAQFLGSTNNQPIEFRVNDQRALRLEPTIGTPHLIGGWRSNSILSGLQASVIAGGGYPGFPNRIFADSSFIGGGYGNEIGVFAHSSVIGGGTRNKVLDGQTQFPASINVTIGGGGQNVIGSNSYGAAIVGGEQNQIGANAPRAAIGGGGENQVGPSALGAVIAGGERNQVSARYGTVAGGSANRIQTSGSIGATISGGTGNMLSSTAPDAVIAGGANNSAENPRVVVGGGADNRISSGSSEAVIGGGSNNNIFSGQYSVIPGGANNRVNGAYSFAAGRQAEALEPGSFVWADATGGTFGNLFRGSNQFLLRATGGMGVNTNDPAGVALNVNGTVRAHRFEGDGSGLTGVAVSLQSGATYPGTFTLSGPVTLGGVAGVPFAVGNNTLVPNLNAALLGGLPAGSFWQLGGNLGTVPGTHFLGTADNQPLELKVNGARALRLEPAGATFLGSALINVVGGYSANAAAGSGITIAGGGGTFEGADYPNFALANYSAIGGGLGNTNRGKAATISGGMENGIEPSFLTDMDGSSIAGGRRNLIQTDAIYSAIGGGLFNTIQRDGGISVIAGGEFNRIGADTLAAVLGGGTRNTVGTNAYAAVLGGGQRNLIETGARSATIAGGATNVVRAATATIGGGRLNDTSSADSTVAGGAGNVILDLSPGAAIGGGGQNGIGSDSGYTTVAGGVRNTAGSGFAATISGGATNRIATSGEGGSTIAGGVNNSVTSASLAVISGGFTNRVEAGAHLAVVAGGRANQAGSGAEGAVLAGGLTNTIGLNAVVAAIGGGQGNRIGSDAALAVIAGGQANDIQTSAFGGAIGGGLSNVVGATAAYGTVPGGSRNTAGGTNSLAAGYRAKALHAGTFVWADRIEADFNSTAPHQFLVRATGGLGVNTNDPAGAALNVLGTVRATRFEGDGSALTGVSATSLTGGTLTSLLTFSPPTGPPFAVGNNTLVPNLNAEFVGGLRASNFWQLGGNAGTVAGTHFLGTTDNQPVELKVNGARALRIEPAANGAPNSIGGAANNFVLPGVYGATIAGGGAASLFGLPVYSNAVTANFGTIGGGAQNLVWGAGATIVGGMGNSIGTNANAATIGGGQVNVVSSGATNGTIGGGVQNLLQTNATYATIAGGRVNTVGQDSTAAAIGGGELNEILGSAAHATIAGGFSNRIATNSPLAFIGGGQGNTIQRSSFGAVISGGASNLVDISSPGAAIVGGVRNVAGNSATNAFVGGGEANNVGYETLNSAIVAGTLNFIDGSRNSAVVGGVGNSVIRASESFTGGGKANSIFESTGGVIGGGQSNRLSIARHSVVGGGQDNQVSESQWVVIAGGRTNTVSLDALYSVIGGGTSNRITSGALLTAGTIAGGVANVIEGDGRFGFIGGGTSNLVSGARGTVPGGRNNEAGADAFAAGTRARAVHRGAFVWADSTDADVFSGGNNSFVARAAGGVTFYSDTATSSGVVLPAGSGAWATLSDRNAKTNLTAVNPRAVLERLGALPLATWNYRSQDASVRHIGPMAQDFAAAFGLGEDERRISTVDADGVAFAAIQGLHQIVKEKDTELRELRGELHELRKLVEALVKKGGQ